MRAIDLTGMRFGKLVVRELVSTGRHRKWLCDCDCGQTSTPSASGLKSGNSKACGKCRVGTKTVKHGHTWSTGKSPTYLSWRAMKSRCNNSTRDGAKYYVDRGIGYDVAWEKFESFLADMGVRPVGTTLDRINNDLGYSKANCRWATPYQQTHNRRKNRGATRNAGVGGVGTG